MSSVLPPSLQQIQAAVDFIEARLSRPLDAASIAAAAGLSVSRLHRLFRAVAGESVMEYVRHRRLVLAAHALRQSRATILEIALASGFESHETFIRAFQRRFKINPSRFRRLGSGFWHLPHKPGITVDYLAHLYRNFSMAPEVRYLTAMRLIGRQDRFYGFHHPQENVFTVIPALWERLWQEGTDLYRPGSDAVGVIENPDCLREEVDLHRYTAAFQSDASVIPPGWIERCIPAGRYACFMHRATPQDYAKSYLYMYGVWLPQSEEESDCRAELELNSPEFLQGTVRSACPYARAISNGGAVHRLPGRLALSRPHPASFFRKNPIQKT